MTKEPANNHRSGPTAVWTAQGSSNQTCILNSVWGGPGCNIHQLIQDGQMEGQAGSWTHWYVRNLALGEVLRRSTGNSSGRTQTRQVNARNMIGNSPEKAMVSYTLAYNWSDRRGGKTRLKLFMSSTGKSRHQCGLTQVRSQQRLVHNMECQGEVACTGRERSAQAT